MAQALDVSTNDGQDISRNVQIASDIQLSQAGVPEMTCITVPQARVLSWVCQIRTFHTIRTG